MKSSLCILLVFFLSFLSQGIFGQSYSSLVKTGSDGKLVYIPFANTGESNEDNIIPDFSYAGYKFGGVALPEAPVVLTLNPLPGDNLQQIEEAISTVSALPPDSNGIRGAILFKAGKYEVSAPFQVKTSGIILRGEGQKPADQGGTELFSSATYQHDFITFKGSQELSSSGEVLDTLFIPKADNSDPLNPVDGKFWVSCDVRQGVDNEYSGDKTLSLYLVADVNDFTSFNSKDNTAGNIPYISLTLHLLDSKKDTVVILNPTDDVFVQGGEYAAINYGTDKNLSIKNAGVNNRVTREIFIKFALPSYNANVLAAELFLYCSNAGNTYDMQNFVTAIPNDNWNENTVTYLDRPNIVSGQRITSPYVPSGGRTINVTNGSGFFPGDRILVTRTPNDAWINALGMAQYGWLSGDYRVSYERTITEVSGNSLTIDIPLVQSITENYGGGEVFTISTKSSTSNCGIENMVISSFYTADDDEAHGWQAVVFSGTSDCWAKNVTARYFGYSCVGLFGAFRTTVQECAMLDPKSITTGSRKYSFYIDKGSFNLFQRCYTRGGRHDYVTGSRVAGPNAFVDCVAEQTYADIGPHHRYATGILFDNIRGGETRVQNRKDMGSGHGWSGAQTMFWNLETPTNVTKVESPLGAMNWGIGCTGKTQEGAGFWEKWGTHVLPRSLYLKQLEDRMGVEAVLNTTTLTQRNGRIWDALKNWSGIGILADSLPSDNALLADLMCNDTTVTGFNPAVKFYEWKIQAGSNVLPDYSWVSYDTSSKVDLVPAASLSDTTVITVTAGDGISTSVYKIAMAFKSSNANLLMVKVDGMPVEGFTPGQKEYTVEIPFGSSKIPLLSYTTENAFAKVEINGPDTLPGSVVLHVTAEDGIAVETYKIHYIFGAASSVCTLADLKINGFTVSGFSPDIAVYDVVLPASTTSIPAIAYSLVDKTATPNIIPASGLPGTTLLEITAQDKVSVCTYTVNFTLATGTNEEVMAGTRIYPNPVSGELFLDLPLDSKVFPDVLITNSLGQVVLKKKPVQSQTGIAVEFLPEGVYQLILVSGKEIVWRKSFVKTGLKN